MEQTASALSPALPDPSGLDRALRALHEQKNDWARLPLLTKVVLLDELKSRTRLIAPQWVSAALRAKGIPLGSPLAGEEWMSGPWAVLAGIVGLRRTLSRLVEGVDLLRGYRVRERDGRAVVEVLPATIFDRVLLSGYSAEVWMRPGISPDRLRDRMASFYRQEEPSGAVALVLGAGNIASIAPLDVLYQLFAEGRVVVCKLNPVNEYLGPFLERAFAPLVEGGFVRFVYGGADVGSYLVRHRQVEHVHITGSARTHDAIVFGDGVEGARRKAAGEPLLEKSITSELGGVGPTIIVPGPWSEADLRHHAENFATQKLHNAGFNCIASQVLVLHEQWPLKDRFLELVREVVAAQPPRDAYYPGAAQRQQEAVRAHPEHETLGGMVPRTRLIGLDPERDEPFYTTEAFGMVWGETAVSARDEADFLQRAVDFANARLMGSLGAQIIVHPKTAKKLGGGLEEAIANLRYGTVAVNVWSGVGFLLANAAWGAYPGNEPSDIQSGRGFVHNALLFDEPERTVVRGPFAPFPRSLKLGERHTSPKPPWFVTHRRADRIGELLADFEAAPSWRKLPPIIALAMMG